MLKFIVCSIAVVAALSGCATSTIQTDALLKDRAHQPRQHLIAKVPFVNQEAGHCGPATLTMAMNFSGHEVSVEQIASQAFTPGMKGTFQTDMISASRRNGRLAIPIEGMSNLLTEIAANHPVIVFENLALEWIPQWHYALVFGYDLERETVQMHSGPERNKIWDIRKLERSWKLADYWGLVVLPPDQLAATADELSHLKAAAGLEQAGRKSDALTAYQTILRKWPASLASLIALSNKLYEDDRSREAVKLLEIATREHPRNASAWHNRAHAEAAAHQAKAARASAQRALALVSDDLRPQYENSLRPILK